MAVSDAYNFRQVNERLATAGVISEQQLSELSTEGYRAVINLLPEDSPYAVAGERAIVEGQGLAYTHIPVDFAAPTEADFQAFCQAMGTNADVRLMVHCAANYRVSAFYALYAVERLGWSPEQAREFIAATWNLEEQPVWQAFVEDHLKPA